MDNMLIKWDLLAIDALQKEHICLNLLLIPILGAIGAAAASLITQVFSNIILLFFFKEIRRSIVLIGKGLNIKVIISILKQTKRVK